MLRSILHLYVNNEFQILCNEQQEKYKFDINIIHSLLNIKFLISSSLLKNLSLHRNQFA